MGATKRFLAGGTCLSLTSLQTFPVSPGPALFHPTGDGNCVGQAGVDMYIGTGRYATEWQPTSPVIGVPGLAIGPLVGGNAPGTATLVGSCGNPRGTASGTMVMTMTVGGSY